MDKFILDFINTNMTSDFLDGIMPYITMLGDHGIFYILLGLILLIPKKMRMVGVAMLLALIFESVTVNLILKPLVGRTRPFEYMHLIDLMIDAPKDYSFPSGHTAASFAVATVIYMWHKKWGIVAMVVAALVAFSRLYLYVHWPSDVIAGLVIGIIAGIASVLVLTKTKIEKHFKYNPF